MGQLPCFQFTSGSLLTRLWYLNYDSTSFMILNKDFDYEGHQELNSDLRDPLVDMEDRIKWVKCIERQADIFKHRYIETNRKLKVAGVEKLNLFVK